MSWDDVFWHLINFVLPALTLSLALTAWGSYQYRRQAQISWLWRWLVSALAGAAVLAAGLLMSGQDGQMSTYGALIVVCATVEWAMQLRLWRRD
jgi:hypothetical protein